MLLSWSGCTSAYGPGTIADHVEVLQTYERSVLGLVATRQLEALKDDTTCRDRLEGEAVDLPGTAAKVADRVEIGGIVISFADIVFLRAEAGQVVACALEDDSLHLVVETMALVKPMSPSVARCRCTRTTQVWQAAEVQLACAWYDDSGDTVVLRK